MRQSQLDTTTLYAAPSYYSTNPARVIETGRLWTVKHTVKRGAGARGTTQRRLVPAPPGARARRGNGITEPQIGHLILTTADQRTTRERYGDEREAAATIAAVTFPKISTDDDELAARQAAALEADFRLGGLRIELANVVTWKWTWEEHVAHRDAAQAAVQEEAAKARTEEEAATAVWAPIGARLTELGITYTPTFTNLNASLAFMNGSRPGAVTSVTLNVTELAKLLDMIAYTSAAEAGENTPFEGHTPPPPVADGSPSGLVPVTPFAYAGDHFLTFCETARGKTTWGVRRTDEEAAILTRGRPSEHEAVTDAKRDIDGINAVLGRNL